MHLNIPHEDLDKKRIDRFILRSLAAALLLGALLIAGALHTPNSLSLNNAKTKTTAVGPIQSSFTMISSLGRVQKRRDCHVAEAPTQSTAATSLQHTPSTLLKRALAPFVSHATFSLSF